MIEKFTSKALLANLAYTFVENVEYDPKYNVFPEIYAKFPALRQQIETLLKEAFHPYKNNFLVLEELRSYFLKNLSILLKHPYRNRAYWLIFDLLFKFFGKDQETNIKTAETIFSILDKTADLIDQETFYELIPVLKEILKAITNLPEEYFLNFLENYYSFKRLVQKLSKLSFSRELELVYIDLLKKTYISTYTFWGKLAKTCEANLIQNPSDIKLKENFLTSTYFESLINSLTEKSVTLSHLLSLPDHLDLLKKLKDFISSINQLNHYNFSDELKINFLFDLIKAPILKLIHEELIKEVNRNLILMINSKPYQNLDEFIRKFFDILKEKLNLYPRTALECIKNIGICILNKKEVYLIEVLINEIIKFGFQPPQIKGIGLNWKIIQNPHHLLNIKTWLEIFKVNPEWCSSLLAAMILNLRLYGISIKDTDLFQKEITQLLNAPIKPVYNLTKQFCKLLPVYYNEIGAEGLIRDLSTELDELFNRQDSLIHFLRKFIHIENSSLAVEFIKDILKYWFTLEDRHILKYLPEILHNKLKNEEIEIHIKMQGLLQAVFQKANLKNFEELLNIDLSSLEKILKEIDFEETYKKKLYLTVSLYHLEYQKYFGVLKDINLLLIQYDEKEYPFIAELKDLLQKEPQDLYVILEKILDWMSELKEIILSKQTYPPIEEILQKRHVAADIPSMYGRYKEKKFDALGLTFRLEYLANLLFEKLIEKFDLQFITRASFFKILKILKLFKKALEIDGIFSQKFESSLNLLEYSLKSYPLTYSQYLDIFRGLLDGVQHIVKVYYVNPFLKVFPLVFQTLNEDEILEKYKKCLCGLEKEQRYFCISEVVIKDLIGEAFSLTHLDRFLKKIYDILSSYLEKIAKEDLNLLMSYDPRRILSSLHKPNNLVTDLIYLGNKGYILTILAQEQKIKNKIPPGFILTTEVFRCYPLIKKYPELWLDYTEKIEQNIKMLEDISQKVFGGKENPLVVSIRSGAALSMPGMMNSILNVGLNLETVEGLARASGNTWFAWDTYRRFIQSWAMAFGVPRDFFNHLMREHKRKYKVKKKREFSGEQMQELALLYRKSIQELGIPVIDDPWEQLFKGIELILTSWFNEKAKSYREIMQLSDEWGTAVIIQQMVFGNIGDHTGTGVTLTTSPVGKFPRIILWGDYTSYNQGEDIVSGLVNAYPISIEQKKIEEREGPCLQEAFPDVYKALLDLAYYLVYEKGWGHQEIEFTFEGNSIDSLYILQVRDIILREERDIPFFSKELLKNLEYIGKGIGVTGGLISGRIVFGWEDIITMDTGDPLVLVRYDTVPDNIKEIHKVDGILTARGGQTSHAAIVASRLGKICVVGCENLSIDEIKKEAKINGHKLRLGEWITLNGITGQVFKGKIDLLTKASKYNL